MLVGEQRGVSNVTGKIKYKHGAISVPNFHALEVEIASGLEAGLVLEHHFTGGGVVAVALSLVTRPFGDLVAAFLGRLGLDNWRQNNKNCELCKQKERPLCGQPRDSPELGHADEPTPSLRGLPTSTRPIEGAVAHRRDWIVHSHRAARHFYATKVPLGCSDA